MTRPTTLLFAAALAACASCRQTAEPPAGIGPADPASAPPPGSAAAVTHVLAIATNTQVTQGELRIGAGNVWDAEYDVEGGGRTSGPTAGLWFYFRDRPSEDRHVRVHPGQKLDVAGHRFEVQSVQRDLVRLAVLQ